MYRKTEMVRVCGEEIKKAMDESGFSRSAVCAALGVSSSFVPNAVQRNRMPKDDFYNFCALLNVPPKRFTPEDKFGAIFNDDYDDEPETEENKTEKEIKETLKPQEGPIETRTGKVLQGAPKAEEPKRGVEIKTKPTDEVLKMGEELITAKINNYEVMWKEIKKFLAEEFVSGDELDLADMLAIVTEIERRNK